MRVDVPVAPVNERSALSLLPALMLGGICFVVCLAVLALMSIAAAELVKHARPQDEFDEYPRAAGAMFIVLPLFGAIAWAGFVVWATQVRFAARVLFQVSFFIGFSLLAYSLWALLVLYRVLSFESSKMLYVTITSVPLICGILIPLALIFLTYATVRDMRTDAAR